MNLLSFDQSLRLSLAATGLSALRLSLFEFSSDYERFESTPVPSLPAEEFGASDNREFTGDQAESVCEREREKESEATRNPLLPSLLGRSSGNFDD